ncbi:MAG: hypothetical protein MUF42_02995 [Cytophagaceae bacterium]|jgi:hypothetical protein|nr:hypothetical protein [Cytophagaceae bacterium]
MKKNLHLILLVVFLSTSFMACRKKSYPCPGLGQVSEADLSQFDENGQLKNGSGKKKKKGPVRRINHESGLVNKKSPKQIRAPRKTKL